MSDNPLFTQFDHFMDLSQDFICVYDFEGVIRRVNPAFERLCGSSQPDLQGKHYSELIHPDDRGSTAATIASVVSGDGATHIRNRTLHSDGASRWVEWSVFGIADAGLVIATGRDVTDVVTTEEQLARTEERLELAGHELAESNDAVLWIAADGRITDTNASAREWLGYTEKEMALLTYADVDLGVTSSMWPEHWKAVKEAGSQVFEANLQCVDGSSIPVEVTMNCVAVRGEDLICAFVRDVRDRRLAEEKEQESAQRIRAIFEAAAVGIVTINLDSIIQTFNPAAEKMFGYTADEIVGRDVCELMPSPYREEHAGHITRYVEGRGGTSVGRVRVLEAVRKDGTVFPIELTISEVPLEGDNIFTGFINDVSERQEAEERLRGLNDLLSVLNKAQAAFIGEGDRKSLFDGLLESVLTLTDSEYGLIGEVLEDDGVPYLKTYAITNIAWDEESKARYEAEVDEGLEFRNLDSLFGHVIHTHEPLISNAPAEDERRGGLPEGHPQLNAFLGLPVMRGTEMLGMVGIANREGGYDATIVGNLEPFLVTTANIIAGYRDRTRREEAEAALNKLARNDALTDLPNRRAFIEAMGGEIARAERYGSPLTMLMLDLDGFKGVNDTYGHTAGDQVLIGTADIMRQVARQSDTASRLGGEEFGFLLPQTTENSAKVLAERFREKLEQKVFQADDGQNIHVTTSIGLATFNGEEDLDSLMKRADVALYRAKDTGRNRVCVWEPSDATRSS